MKKLLIVLALTAAAKLLASPSLILIDRDNLKGLESQVSVIRDHGSRLFVVTELSALPANATYELLDEDYRAGQYLLVRGPQTAAQKGLPIVWQDEAGALVRLSSALDAISIPLADAELLERPLPLARESRPPSHLDDPVLDQWLTDLAADVNADSLFASVTTLASYNRYTRWTSNDDAATWIRNRFQSYGLDSAYFHPFTATGSGWSRTANNVIGVKVGSVYPDSIVLIGGHMDATSQSPAQGAPGADDNASGTAGVIEAVRLLSPYQFSHTLMFVAFNGEEQGLQGSDVLATQMAAAGRDITAVLNMDMIGYYDPAGDDLWLEGFYTGNNSIWLTDVLWDNCLQFTDLAPYLYPSNGWGSDHESFHDAGYPAVLTIENEYDSYACYHQLCDLPANITPDFLRKMSVVNIVSGAELALPLGTGSISGTVTLEDTQDYSDVLVRVVGGSAATTTAANGTYLLTNLLAGNYDLSYSRPGWISDTLTSIMVQDDQETPGHNIFLNAATPGSISGMITLSGGGGIVTDAIVYVEETIAFPNEAGSYLLNPLFSGQHVVTAALDNYALTSTVVTLGDGQNLTGVNLTLYPLWDLEASNYGLNNNGTGWGWGTDAVAGSHSPTHVWGTVLGGNYVNCGNYQLDMPPVSLANLDSARLTFWHWYDIEPSGPTMDYDGANVKLAPFGTNDWQVIPPVGGYPQGAGYTCNPIQNEPAYNGTTGGWVQVTFNLNAFIGQTVRIRFHLGSDQGVTDRGWYIDDLALVGWHSAEPTAPDAVNDLSIHPLGTAIQLRWSASSGALTYRIYRAEDNELPFENWTLLAEQAETTYVDDGASALNKAFYAVVAVN